MAYHQHPDQTPAQAVRAIAEATLSLALDVAHARATDLNSHPAVPQSGVAEWLTRRLLADLLDAGFAPDGWESAYVEDAPSWGDPWVEVSD